MPKPLTEPELKRIYRKEYNYGCSSIRDKSAYVKCDNCEYRFKDGRLKDSNILIKNIRILPELSNAEAKIALMLGIFFNGESPTINKIALKAKMDYRTVGKAINILKKRGIVNKSLYN